MDKIASRYTDIASSFRESFPKVRQFSLYRAPGRVNLIGEHTDYNGLPVLPMAIEQDISICASARDDNRVVIKNTDPLFEDRQFTIDSKISPYPKGDWGNYCKAAVQALQGYLAAQKKEKRLLKGINALIDGNIPRDSGLSSSSALVVAAGVAVNDLNELGLGKLSLAELLAKGERYVGTEGGGMDQAVSICGKKGMVLKIDFFPLRIEYVPFPEDYAIVVCNSLVDAKKSTGANLDYNQRAAECRLGVTAIKKFIKDKYKADCDINLLGDLKKSEFSHLLEDVDGMLDAIFPGDDIKKSRLRHVFTEAERVERSKECIKNGRIEEFGQLMYQSHKSCAQDYEISCPELDKLVEVARKNGAAGARLTGAGFGGCTVNLVHKEKVDEFKSGVVDGYYKGYLKRNNNLSDYLFVCQPSEGAGKVKSRGCGELDEE